MISDAGGLWPQDPEAQDDNRSVDDLEIPDDADLFPDEEDTVPTEVDDTEVEGADEWGDDADNRLVDLSDDPNDGPDDDETPDR